MKPEEKVLQEKKEVMGREDLGGEGSLSREAEVGKLGSRVVRKENTMGTVHKNLRGFELIYFNFKPLTLLK